MDAIIPRLERFAIEGMFGEINLLRVGQSPDEEKSRTSQVYFFEVDLVTRKGKVRKVPVAVKLLPDTPLNISHYANFGNEVTVYREVLPSLRAQEIDLHPTVYYAESTVGKYLGEMDILILEDVRRKGFNVPKNVFLDANHINLAVKKLGEFHGLAYRLKLESPEKFENVKDLLPKMYQKSSDVYVKAAIHRALEEELENSPGYSVLSRALKKMCDKNIYDLMYQYLCAPEEPYAVVVHGQFMMGNVLFQYDEEERPCGIKVVDFSLAEYADPTVDLSVFLCMHASEEREENWNDHLKSYWEGVLSVGNPGFTYEEFAKNFAKKAIYGFIRSVFLLPLTFDEVRGNDIFTDEFKATSDQTKRERSYTIGGDDATKAVRSLARFFHSEGYLEEYLLNFKQ